MSSGQLHSVMRQIRRAAGCERDEPTDGQLLTRYLVQREQTAFEELVRRHGPMVLGVCRRVLGKVQDAEDAFQATFLVLVRKAQSIRDTRLLGNWLYGVAYRTAMKARGMDSRRRVREREAEELRHSDHERQRFWQEVQPLLDQELSALPEKYRVPILLCDLEGRTRKEAAEKLGWPEGTVATRLAEGRNRLAKRLARQGVTISSGTLALAVGNNVALAAVPPSLVTTTVQAANLCVAGNALVGGAIAPKVAALTEKMLKGTLVTKAWIALAVLATAALIGVGVRSGEFISQPEPMQVAGDQTSKLADRILAGNAQGSDKRPSKESGSPAPTPPYAGLDPLKDPLDRLLIGWEEAMAEVQTIAAEVQRITWQNARETPPPSQAGKYLRGQNGMSSRASLYAWRVPASPNSNRHEVRYSMQYLPGVARAGSSPEAYMYERYLYNGSQNLLFISAPVEKVLQVHRLPPPAPGRITDDSFLSLIFDVGAVETKKRYELSYIGESPESPELFHRLKIMPLQPQDKADFAEGRLVLHSKNFLPQQLWFRQPDSKTVTWNFLKADVNVEIPLSEFEPPDLPAGWKLERVPAKKT
jgi:RNA polymerase sigma factor (sigma-70 family)